MLYCMDIYMHIYKYNYVLMRPACESLGETIFSNNEKRAVHKCLIQSFCCKALTLFLRTLYRTSIFNMLLHSLHDNLTTYIYVLEALHAAAIQSCCSCVVQLLCKFASVMLRMSYSLMLILLLAVLQIVIIIGISTGGGKGRPGGHGLSKF